MAVVNFYQTYNMPNDGLWLGRLDNTSSSSISVSDSVRDAIYYGSFKYAKNGLLSGGKITGYEQTLNDVIDFTVSDVNLNALKILKFHQTGNGIGLQKYVLSGNDVITGSAYQDYLIGYNGNDVISGNEGSDFLDGSKGKDKLSGGTGDDTYFVDNAGDLVSEYTDEGYDVVKSSVNYSLTTNVEGLVLTGKARINATGNESDNHIVGNASANTIRGAGGNDVIDGAAGNDRIFGGAGNDTLSGGVGSDTFTWVLSDKGVAGTPSTDVITDFSLASKDKLDLKGLLQGESRKDISGLQNFIDISFNGSNTEISISANGGFTNHIYNASAEDAHITLMNVNLLGTLSEEQLLKNLIDNKFLVID